jgi:transcriptional regulator with XRE-family HTH domain
MAIPERDLELLTVAHNSAAMSSTTSLRAARAQRLMTIRELAKRASVAPSTVYLIEAGRTIPHLRVVRQLAVALGVQPLEIDEFKRTIDVRGEALRPRQPRQSATDGGHRGDPSAGERVTE